MNRLGGANHHNHGRQVIVHVQGRVAGGHRQDLERLCRPDCDPASLGRGRRLAAEYSDVPIINAGDGGHEHPTQTLLDLYTLRNEYKTLECLRIAICGDLKNSRTVHSLVYALIRFGAEIVFVPAQGLELPDHVRHKMETVYDRRIERVDPGGLESPVRRNFGKW